jgi:Na+-driven multidrug efflux pump
MMAQQDSLMPCLAVVLMVVASLLANVVFVAGLGLGIHGAAVTTTVTQ